MRNLVGIAGVIGNKNRAIESAMQASKLFAKTPKRFQKVLDEVDAWLRSVPSAISKERLRQWKA